MISKDKKRITLTLSFEINECLEKIAKEKGISKSALVSILISNFNK